MWSGVLHFVRGLTALSCRLRLGHQPLERISRARHNSVQRFDTVAHITHHTSHVLAGDCVLSHIVSLFRTLQNTTQYIPFDQGWKQQEAVRVFTTAQSD